MEGSEHVENLNFVSLKICFCLWNEMPPGLTWLTFILFWFFVVFCSMLRGDIFVFKCDNFVYSSNLSYITHVSLFYNFIRNWWLWPLLSLNRVFQLWTGIKFGLLPRPHPRSGMSERNNFSNEIICLKSRNYFTAIGIL